MRRAISPEDIERRILDRLLFHARFRDLSDRKAETAWQTGIDGTMVHVDRLEDDLFRETREATAGEDLLRVVTTFQDAFRAAIHGLIQKKLVHAFTDGYTIFERIHVPLPNPWQRMEQRVKGLTLTSRGVLRARRLPGASGRDASDGSG